MNRAESCFFVNAYVATFVILSNIMLCQFYFWVQYYSKKQNTRFRECFICFGCETKTGVVRILVIFQGSHIYEKLSPIHFE